MRSLASPGSSTWPSLVSLLVHVQTRASRTLFRIEETLRSEEHPYTTYVSFFPLFFPLSPSISCLHPIAEIPARAVRSEAQQKVLHQLQQQRVQDKLLSVRSKLGPARFDARMASFVQKRIDTENGRTAEESGVPRTVGGAASKKAGAADTAAAALETKRLMLQEMRERAGKLRAGTTGRAPAQGTNGKGGEGVADGAVNLTKNFALALARRAVNQLAGGIVHVRLQEQREKRKKEKEARRTAKVLGGVDGGTAEALGAQMLGGGQAKKRKRSWEEGP